jgi:hexosaminidase
MRIYREKYMLKFYAGLLFALALFAGIELFAASGPMVIPYPREIKMTGGECYSRRSPKKVKVSSIPAEGYELSIKPNEILVRYGDAAGAFYADITLSHLARYDKKSRCLVYPCLEIKDSPKFKWRGILIDESRHFMGKDTIKRILHQMSLFKMNVLHWHLMDDQLWALEIPGYPELQKYGAEFLLPREDPWPKGEKVANGYYTANDVKEIVAFAKARHITIVPEVELPAHAASAILAYPELCCFPEQIYSKNRNPYKFNYSKFTGIYCFGKPETIKFLEKVFDYVCELFPSEVIHIGGDECFRDNWKKCPHCKEFMKREGLTGVAQIQPWVTRYFTEYLAKKGRKAIGWDQIFIESEDRNAGGAKITSLLPKTTMGMCYRTNSAGAAAANQGFDIVMTPHIFTYFDYKQGLANDPFIYFPGGPTSLAKVYRFDPLAGVEDAAQKHVIGGQCCNWTSHTYNRIDLEWKLWPRGFAIAEILWTYPDPKNRDFAGFSVRAEEFRRRFVRSNINCAPLK